MGGSSSKNVTSLTMKALMNVTTKMFNKQTVKSIQSQGVVIENAKQVDIGSINQSITMNVQTESLLKSLSTTNAQQNLIAQVTQAAQSLTKGINIFNFADASNELDEYLEQSMNILTSVSQLCEANLATTQSIVIEKVDMVHIGSINQESIANIWNKCVVDAVSNTTAVQKMQTTIDQSAKATVIGINPWMFFILAALVIIAVILGIVFEGSVISKLIVNLIFPGIMIAGIVFIVLWSKSKGKFTYMMTGFFDGTKGLSGKVATTSNDDYDTAAAKAKDGGYDGFSWVGYDVDVNSGIITKKAQPVATFYSKVYTDPNNIPQYKNIKLFTAPNILVGADAPKANTPGGVGDAYIATSNSTLWENKKNVGWSPISTFNKGKPSGKMAVGQGAPPAANRASLNTYMDISNPKSLYFYSWDGKWSEKPELVDGPGYKTAVPSPFNAAGIKKSLEKKWELYVGISCMVLGFVGFVIFLVLNVIKSKKGKGGKKKLKKMEEKLKKEEKEMKEKKKKN